LSHDVTCRDFVDVLDAYLSGSLDQGKTAAFNEHLAACPSCVAYMKTYQASIRLGKAVLTRSDESLPEDVPEALVQAILAARKKP
jgi:anti-sigma factor RsiW